MEAEEGSAEGEEPSPGPSGTQPSSQRNRPERKTTRTTSQGDEGRSEDTVSRPEEQQQQESNMNEDSNQTSSSATSGSTVRGTQRPGTTTDDDDDDDEDHLLNHDPTPSHHPYPVPKWFSVKQLQERELGRNLVSHFQRKLTLSQV